MYNRNIGPIRALSSPHSPSQRLSFGSIVNDPNPAAAADDEDDVAELVALLARARLVPTSSRLPIATLLYTAGIGSAEALALAVDRDPMFLSNQVLALRSLAFFMRSHISFDSAFYDAASSGLYHHLHCRSAQKTAAFVGCCCCRFAGGSFSCIHAAQSPSMRVVDSQ
jgi:hypothetical protein